MRREQAIADARLEVAKGTVMAVVRKQFGEGKGEYGYCPLAAVQYICRDAFVAVELSPSGDKWNEPENQGELSDVIRE